MSESERERLSFSAIKTEAEIFPSALEAENQVLIATNSYRESRAATRSCEQRPEPMYLNKSLCTN